MSDLVLDLSGPLKVKSNRTVELPICDFLLVLNSNYMCISHRLEATCIATQIVFSYHLLSLSQLWDPHTHPYLGQFFSKLNHFLPESEGRPPPKLKSAIFSIFMLLNGKTAFIVYAHKDLLL